jgi:hypothetical protein
MSFQLCWNKRETVLSSKYGAELAPYSLDDDLSETAPLTPGEQAAVKRAEVDVAAGHLQDQNDVARWLRQRAEEIVARLR